MHARLVFLAAAMTTALLAPAAALAESGGTTAETALTIYNRGPAVVWQTRTVTLEQGRQTIHWPGTSAQLVAESLWLAGDGVTLASATIAGDRASPAALLARRIGQTVTLLSTESERTRQVTLVSVRGTRAVVRAGGRLELIDGRGGWRIAWPAPGYSTGLKLTVRAESGGRQAITLAYQRAGVNWHASYTTRFYPNKGLLKLQSLAVIENHGNASLQADQVTLVAGDVARASTPRPRVYMTAQAARAKATPEPEPAGGYYRYRLDGPVGLRAGATQVVALMQARTLEVEREYVIEGAWYRGGSGQRSHATIRLSFDNTTGRPLPAGPVRVYGRGRAMLLGEDRIGNVPEGAPVTLVLGRAFDITAERRITRSSEHGDVHKRTVEIAVYNARGEAVTVTVVEHLPDDAEIVFESDEHASRTARKTLWRLDVPADGKTVLTYTIRWLE